MHNGLTIFDLKDLAVWAAKVRRPLLGLPIEDSSLDVLTWDGPRINGGLIWLHIFIEPPGQTIIFGKSHQNVVVQVIYTFSADFAHAPTSSMFSLI
jgi:hypothetical protein